MAVKGNSAPAHVKGAESAGLAVEQWPTSRPKPYDKNPRAINDKAIGKVAASIQEYGWQQPIVVDKDDVVIIGHTRLKAAQSLGLATVPVVVARNLSDARVRGLRLADNRTHQETDWLEALLAEELSALKGLDFDLALTGFDERELDKLLLDDAELARAEETPPVPEVPVTIKGDVWVLGGKHRVVCGDSTIATDVDKALNGVKPHLCVTDPPYGVEYDANWRNEALRSDGSPIGGRAIGKVLNDDRADWTEAYNLFPGDVMYVWHPAGAKQVDFYNSIVAAGFDIRMQIVWAKPRFVIGRGNYHVGHEPCWYAVRKKQKATAHWQGDRTQSTVWQISHQKSETGHSTQKPIECMLRPIKNNSSPGQAVFDPFLGSGTSVIAATMSDRICLGLELNEAYCDVIVQRFIDFSGEQAVLEGDGRTFDEIKQSRHGKDTKDAA